MAWFPLVLDRGLKGLVKRLLIAGVLLAALSAGGLAAHLAMLAKDLPALTSMEDYRPPVTSRVFDQAGHLVARFYEERRTLVSADKIPALVREAFISAEDEDFYKHAGVDYAAIVRCVLLSVKSKLIGGAVCGGSTITQQTAKTFLLSSERTYSRKLKELLLAKRIEERFTKDEILALYLNQIYFGNGAYGIEEAARTYYGVGVDKLTLAQAAALASIPKSPNRINPFADPVRVRARRGYVLEQMRDGGYVAAADVTRAKEQPVRVDVSAPEFLDIAPYYAEAIRRTLSAHPEIGPDEVTRGGLTVYAALDARMQKAANAAVEDGLRALDKRQGYRGPLVRLDPDEAQELLARLNDERARRFPPSETPELKSEDILGRPIWDLKGLTKDVFTRELASHEDEDDNEDADAAVDGHHPAQAPPTKPPLRQVSSTRVVLGNTVGAVVTKVNALDAVVDLGTLEASLPASSTTWARPFSPERSTEKPRNIAAVLKPGDIILVHLDRVRPATAKAKARLEVSLDQAPKVEAALVAVDPTSHKVLALVGGYDFARSSFNRATQARRQPGSAFKPFIYATGIESKLFTPVGFFDAAGASGGAQQRLITDAPKVFFDRWTGQKWQPQNSGGRYLGDITLRTCLTHSINTCSITIVERTGVEPILDIATKLGLSTDDHPFPKNLTLALGTGEVIPLDLINGYSVFANGGTHAPPVLIEKVKRADGRVVEMAVPDAVQVLSPAAAYVTVDMMKSVVESGTATRARELGRPVAGKTGTTQEARSVWFVGLTPDLVAGVYVGFDDNEPLGRNESGGRAAVPIWLSFMKEAVAGTEPRDFVAPEGVVRRGIDSATGLLAHVDPSAPAGVLKTPTVTEEGDEIPEQLPRGVVAEVFLAGTEPLMTADDAPPPPLESVERGGLSP